MIGAATILAQQWFRRAITGCVILCHIQFASAQVPPIEWQRSLGGTGDDFPNSIQQTGDAGFVVAGRTSSLDGDVSGNHGNADIWVVKLDSSGNIQWQKALGGSGQDEAVSIKQTVDNGFIVLSSSNSIDGDVLGNHGAWDLWVVKLNALGSLQWQRTYGGSGYELAHSIELTDDGGYVIAGSTDSDDGDVSGAHGPWIVKLEESGNIQWQKCLGTSYQDEAASAQETLDGGYFAAGWGYSNEWGSFYSWVVKMDENGNVQWQNLLGSGDDARAFSAQQTDDGGYILAGDASPSSSGGQQGPDCWVSKLDESGALIWQRTLGGSYPDEAYSVVETSVGGYLIAAHTLSGNGDVSWQHGAGDVWIVKLDSNGETEQQGTFGGTGVESGKMAQQTADGGIIIDAYSNSNAGDVTGNHGGFDFWIVKLEDNLVDVAEPRAKNMAFEVFPNPSTGAVRIRRIELLSRPYLVVRDVMGREVIEGPLTSMEQTLDLSGFPRGVYSVSLRSDGEMWSQRLVLE